MKISKRTIVVITAGTLLIGGLAACKPGSRLFTPEERGERVVEKISEKLELNQAQQLKLAEVKNEFLAMHKTMRSNREQTRADAMAMLKQPTLDRDRLNTLVGQHIATINLRSPSIIAAIGDFYDSLDDSQRTELREIIEHKMEHRQGNHH